MVVLTVRFLLTAWFEGLTLWGQVVVLMVLFLLAVRFEGLTLWGQVVVLTVRFLLTARFEGLTLRGEVVILTVRFLLTAGFEGLALRGEVVILTVRFLLTAGFEGLALRGEVVVLGKEDAVGTVGEREGLRDIKQESSLLELERANPETRGNYNAMYPTLNSTFFNRIFFLFLSLTVWFSKRKILIIYF